MTAFEGGRNGKVEMGAGFDQSTLYVYKKCHTVKGETVCGEIPPILLIWRYFLNYFFHIFLLSYFHWQELSHARDYAVNYWAPLWFSVWDML